MSGLLIGRGGRGFNCFWEEFALGQGLEEVQLGGAEGGGGLEGGGDGGRGVDDEAGGVADDEGVFLAGEENVAADQGAADVGAGLETGVEFGEEWGWIARGLAA